LTRTKIFEKLTRIFREVFEDESLVIEDSTTANDIDDWDSLTHINLIAAIENEFGMEFNMKEIIALKNVGDFVNIIELESKPT
jgi:acyl carrier protein